MRNEDYGVWKQKVTHALHLYDMYGAKYAAEQCRVHVTTIYMWRREAAKHGLIHVPLHKGKTYRAPSANPRRTE